MNKDVYMFALIHVTKLRSTSKVAISADVLILVLILH